MGGVHNMLLGTSITAGKLTLKEAVFNASGTFTMPSGVVDNQIIVGCTGGGGGGYVGYDDGSQYYKGGGGSGRTVTTLTMPAGATATVTVGAGGVGGSTQRGGTSSFTGATSCAGGYGGSTGLGAGVSGGGNGSDSPVAATASSCPSALTLQTGAVNGTTNLWTAKSYAGGATGIYGDGGGGCYGVGGAGNSPSMNTGAGAGSNKSGGSGKVVVWYYTYE